MKLTKTQKIAIEETRADILVSAGAGAGKTRVLVERFLHFVISGKARVTEILTLTFTDKAANEMKKRIMDRFRELDMLQARRDLESAYISTLHAFSVRLLKEHPVEAAVPPDFTVMEQDESDLLQEQALDDLIDMQCTPGSDIFELLRIYGEKSLRNGLKKTLAQARTEGLAFSVFFERQKEVLKPFKDKNMEALFEKAGVPELAAEWNRFAANPSWDWRTVEDFRSWSSGFNKKGGKEVKAYWKEIVSVCARLEGERLDLLAKPWREKFEKTALAFEAGYETKKFEKGVLDFDDLQIKALALLTAPGPGSRKLLEHYRRQFKFVLVDEYQDVNPLQVKLIECFRGESSEPSSRAPEGRGDLALKADCVAPLAMTKPGKMFFVGDYKQSIYGFRGTSPHHFLEKGREYQKGAGLTLEMLENFRTQKPILDFVNLFFERLWAEEALENTGLIAQADVNNPQTPELHVILKKEEESIEQARMREAGMIARRIQELKENGYEYGQMTVLFQAMTNSGIYEHALKSAGIPYFAVSGRGFYHQPEVRDMISLLTALENPLLDIPLAAALRSPFFHISDDTLFWLSYAVKQETEVTPLYEALNKIDTIEQIASGEKEELKKFQAFFTELISVKDRFYISELLEWILYRTAYEIPVLADRQGARRYANLRKLVSLAREHESRERMPLGDFIRLVESFEAREIRESEAQVEAEESGRVVRLMTIHGAKGLEFPVCFVADLAYQSRNPESRDFLAESGSGYSFKIPNAVTRELEKPGIYHEIHEAAERRENEEWKRLMYVAVTRARERLILSGVYEPKKNPKEKFSEMSSWMEWAMTLAPEMPIEVKETAEDTEGLVRRAPKIPAENEIFTKILKKEAAIETLFPDTKERANFAARAEALYRKLESRQVPSGRVIDLPVSAYCAFAKNPLDYWRIYEMGYSDASHEKEMIPRAEEDLQEGSAAEFGIRIHKILELTDFKDPARNLSGLLEEVFRGEGDIRRAEAEKILKGFFESGIFKKLQAAKKIYREIGFSVNERHGRLDGVIDVLFQDSKDDWHILDYKTAVGDEKKVKDSAYDFQMGIYGAAVQGILKKTPETAVLYFLKNQWSQTLALTPVFLKEQAERIRQMQEAMIDYRLQRV